MSAWRLARSLVTLRAQVDAAAPKRSKASDGSIGDSSHAARSSDHNPWVDDGVVTAIDLTHDPKGGCDVDELVAALIRSEDQRIKYLIRNRRIATCERGLSWRPYNGVNPHRKHLHISVKPDRVFYDDDREWVIA